MCTDGSGCSRKTEHFAEAWYVLNINNTWKNSSQKQTYRVKKSYRITAVKPPFLTFSATVPGWDCSNFSQSIKHTHVLANTQTNSKTWWAKTESHMCSTCCARSLFSLTERSFPGRTSMHARFKALGAKGTPGAPDTLPNGPKWGGSAVTMSWDCFYQARCSAHTLKRTHTLMYMLKQFTILLQVHHCSERWLMGGAELDARETQSQWSMSSFCWTGLSHRIT